MNHVKKHSMFYRIMLYTLIGFPVWLLLIYIFRNILTYLGVFPDYWAMTEALSTALAAAALIIGASYVTYRELSEAASSRHLEVAAKLFEELNSQENIKARRWVFSKLPDDPETFLKEKDDVGQAAVKQVLNSLDRVAFLTQEGWIPDDLIMPWMHPMIAKSWAKLERYVKHQRDCREEPYYYQYAQRLAERCEKWRCENLTEEERQIKWIEDAL